jgi:hypothetical protein
MFWSVTLFDICNKTDTCKKELFICKWLSIQVLTDYFGTSDSTDLRWDNKKWFRLVRSLFFYLQKYVYLYWFWSITALRMNYKWHKCVFLKEKWIFLIFISTDKCKLELKIWIFIDLGRVRGLRVHVLNVQIPDSWHFEVQVQIRDYEVPAQGNSVNLVFSKKTFDETTPNCSKPPLR